MPNFLKLTTRPKLDSILSIECKISLGILENVKRALSETIKDECREEAKENRSIADKGSMEEKVTSVSVSSTGFFVQLFENSAGQKFQSIFSSKLRRLIFLKPSFSQKLRSISDICALEVMFKGSVYHRKQTVVT